MPHISVTVDGVRHDGRVEAGLPLSRWLRERWGGGPPADCPGFDCGACVVLVDGLSAKSCAMLTAQADGHSVTTAEGVADDRVWWPVRRALRRVCAPDCGHCAAGMVVAVVDLLRADPDPCDQEIQAGLAGNPCRCVDVCDLVRAVREAAEGMRGHPVDGPVPGGEGG